ncbi:DUF2188 domain-containing protein [Allorhizobium undicola]|uniref:DUF2188 domain-containing protein n=1 Tax=Allorhizobium undicola TaxID=78527 RepID=UPI00068803CD|nr:DUF2188 domain-containing protein [Allorhizobium undicola]
MQITYHVGEHDGGYAYRLRDVWSEPFPDHETALKAARDAAERQHLEGRDAEITYQLGDGTWRTEHASGGDRPETEVVDDVAAQEQAIPPEDVDKH